MKVGQVKSSREGRKEGCRGEEPTGGGGGMGDERPATLPDEVEAARSSTISLLPSAGAGGHCLTNYAHTRRRCLGQIITGCRHHLSYPLTSLIAY